MPREKARRAPRPTAAAPEDAIPLCVSCRYSAVQGETPYCDHPAVKAEHDPLAGVVQPTCLDERTLAPTAANRRVCGHLGARFERRAERDAA